MYAANGIVLNGSEYETLRALAGADDPKALAQELLASDRDRYREVMTGLKDAGLISGVPASNSFVLVQVNESGRSFLRDYDAALAAEREAEESRRREERRRLWSDRRFQIGLSVGTAIASALLSVIASVVTSLIISGGI